MPNLDDILDDGTEAATLMRRFYPLVIESAFNDASLAGVPVAFDLDNPFVQATLSKLAKQIKSVADTTRDEVQRLVGLQAEHGWSVEQLASELQQLVEVRSRTRALLIARTETGTAYNLGSVAAYRAGGVKFVEVLDGDDDEPCATANGQRWTLEQAEANPIAHPNCTRSYIPVVEAE